MVQRFSNDGGETSRPFYIPLFELAGAAAIFGLMRRLDGATQDVLKLKKVVMWLSVGLGGLAIVNLILGVALWMR